MASYIGHIANSFYGAKPRLRRGSTFKPYLAPQSSAFGGTLGSRPAPAAPATAAAGTSAAPTGGVPQGFTASPAGLPPDPGYQQTVAGIDKTTGDTIGGLLAGRNDFLSSAGYTATYDDQGNVTGIAYDPNNPYSQASLLRKNYQQAKTGNTNSYADRGLGYAGSLQNAQDNSTNQFNIGDNNLTGSVIRFLHNNASQISTARDTGETNKGTAFGQMVQNAPGNPLYNPSAAGGGGVYSTDANGNTALTAANGPLSLVPQQTNSTVQLANGWSVLLDAKGNAIKFIPPGG